MPQLEPNTQGVSSIVQELPVAYLEVDVSGAVRAVNEMACLQLSMSAEEIVGQPIWTLVAPDEAAQVRADFLRLMEEAGDPPVVRRTLFTGRGEYRVHELHRRMLRDADGNSLGLSCISIDISNAEASERVITQETSWLHSVVDAIPQAIIATDALGFVRLANHAAEELTGWTARALVGKQIEEALPIQCSVSPTQSPMKFLNTLLESWNGDVDLLNRAGEKISVWLSASPTLDPDTGSSNGVVLVMPSAQARAMRNRRKS